jgi:hypothetical protein
MLENILFLEDSTLECVPPPVFESYTFGTKIDV